MAKVIFKTDQYRRAHNKQPRGLGYWAFEIGAQPYNRLIESGIKLPGIAIDLQPGKIRAIVYCRGGTRSLGEAKKMVRNLFALGIAGEDGPFLVEVAP